MDKDTGEVIRIDWGDVIAYVHPERGELATYAGKKTDDKWNIRECDVKSYLAGVRKAEPPVSRVSLSESPWAET